MRHSSSPVTGSAGALQPGGRLFDRAAERHAVDRALVVRQRLAQAVHGPEQDITPGRLQLDGSGPGADGRVDLRDASEPVADVEVGVGQESLEAVADLAAAELDPRRHSVSD